MSRFVAVALCVVVIGLPKARGADLPAPTEEQIEAKLKEAQKQLEALQNQIQALQKQLAEAKERPSGRITAEVEGTLLWSDPGMGYYIRIRPDDGPKRETRVWLWYGEDKILVRTMEGLRGKQVVATGKLLQAPAEGQGRLPPGVLYLPDFEIKEALPQAKR